MSLLEGLLDEGCTKVSGEFIATIRRVGSSYELQVSKKNSTVYSGVFDSRVSAQFAFAGFLQHEDETRVVQEGSTSSAECGVPEVLQKLAEMTKTLEDLKTTVEKLEVNEALLADIRDFARIRDDREWVTYALREYSKASDYLRRALNSYYAPLGLRVEGVSECDALDFSIGVGARLHPCSCRDAIVDVVRRLALPKGSSVDFKIRTGDSSALGRYVLRVDTSREGALIVTYVAGKVESSQYVHSLEEALHLIKKHLPETL